MEYVAFKASPHGLDRIIGTHHSPSTSPRGPLVAVKPRYRLVKVKNPRVEHTVRMQDLERWLEASARSPAEMALKNRLRKLLAKAD